MTVIQNIEAKRKTLYDDFKKETNKAIIFVIIGVIIIIAVNILMNELFIFSLVVLVVPLIMYAHATRHQRTFKNLVKSELITTILKDKFEEVSYQPQNFIAQHIIDQTGLVKRADQFTGEDYMSGKHGSVYFEASDVTMRERVEHVDSKGNRTVSYPIYFKGRWYIFKFEKQLEGILKVTEGHPRVTSGLTKVETESIQFNKKFKLYASDQQFAFYHLKPIMMEKLLELEKLHRGSIYFYYAQNELHIGVNDSYDYLEFPFNKEINEQSLKVFMSDIDLIPAIIEEMKLESRKFKK